MLWRNRFFTLLAISRTSYAIGASLHRESSLDQQVMSPPTSRNWADETWTHMQGPKPCEGCQSTLLLLKSIALLGDNVFVNAITRACKDSGIQDDDVCQGALQAEGPIIAEGLRNMIVGSKTAQLFCVGLLGLCEYPELEHWSVPFPSSKPRTSRPPPSGRKPLKVVHFSDIHIDHHYVEGANTNCSKPICCRSYSEADQPGNTTSPAGPYGDHQCDVPASLEASMYAAIRELVPDAAFAIFTGDVVDHALWATTQASNQWAVSEAYRNMAKSLQLVYGTAGNHEAHPTNAYQPNSVGMAARWIYQLLSAQWSRWITQKEAEDTANLGTYSAKYPNADLRIISLNTNLYYRQNFWLYQRDMIRDPSNQLAWLVEQLDAAEKAGENVYIIGHMSPGDNNAFHDGANYLDQIINRYSSTIAAMFFGHTHRDEFQITYSDYENRSFTNALATSYIGASLTPTSGMPSFRVYDVDPVTFGVLDVTVYSADMSDDAFQMTGPVWKRYYSAKEAYGPATNPPVTADEAELTPAFWHNVTEAMEAADSELFDAFMSRRSRGWAKENCTDECKDNQICQLRAARSQDNCRNPGSSVSGRADAGGHVEDHLECGYSVAGATLGALRDDKHMLEQLALFYLEGESEERLEL
ncbi:hypothetical protein S40293_10201 [Stachybotrys chartarum IBT 40293]|nr:hypothetical protein S40293_10201 [Stachybotrys chartarum IBT 40293]